MLADAHDHDYRAYASLVDAERDPDAAVIMESDDGGQILLSCPVSVVGCGSARLGDLLVWLDRIAWPGGDDPSARRLLFEHRPIGSRVAGGMRGGVIDEHVWVHDEFERLMLADGTTTIADVARRAIAGDELPLPTPPFVERGCRG